MTCTTRAPLLQPNFLMAEEGVVFLSASQPQLHRMPSLSQHPALCLAFFALVTRLDNHESLCPRPGNNSIERTLLPQQSVPSLYYKPSTGLQVKKRSSEFNYTIKRNALTDLRDSLQSIRERYWVCSSVPCQPMTPPLSHSRTPLPTAEPRLFSFWYSFSINSSVLSSVGLAKI